MADLRTNGRTNDERCSVEGCERTDIHARGWCSKHYQRWKAHGDPVYTKRPTYGTGRRIKEGYVDIWEPNHPLAREDGYVFEHRKVAWDAGILTDPTMQVHHIDHDRQNNELSNLQVVTVDGHIRDHHKPTSGPPAENAKKTHCLNGHPLSGDNIYKSQLPHRICKTCARKRAKEQRVQR